MRLHKAASRLHRVANIREGKKKPKGDKNGAKQAEAIGNGTSGEREGRRMHKLLHRA